ncbi:MAG: hypothetical protein L6Q98_20670 [Anaerolineae bacterium]|nr:hypothetical protein [Anaerolineae bacterium]NUQ06022.1 hypothetical protein [Anaerolineae bacterium]
MEWGTLEQLREWFKNVDFNVDFAEVVPLVAEVFPDISYWIEYTRLSREVREHIAAGKWGSAETLAIRLLRAAEATQVLPLELGAKNTLAEVYSLTNKTREALALYTQIIALSSDRKIQTRFENDIKHLVDRLGPFGTLIGNTFDQNAERIICSAFCSLVDVAATIPEFPLKLLHEVLDDGIQFIESTGHPEWKHGFQFERAYVLELEGQLQNALEEAKLSLASREKDMDGPGFRLVVHLCFVGEYLVMLRRYSEAAQIYDRANSIPNLGFGERRRVLAGLGDVYFYTDNLSDAAELSKLEVSVAQQIDAPAPLRSAYSFHCLVCSRRGEFAEAEHAAACMCLLDKRIASSELHYWTYRRCCQMRFWQARFQLGISETWELPTDLGRELPATHVRDSVKRYIRSGIRWCNRASKYASLAKSRPLAESRQRDLESLQKDLRLLLNFMSDRSTD